MPNEQEKFLEDLKQNDGKADILEAPLIPENGEGTTKETAVTDPEDPEDVPEEVKNRRHKRLEAKLQAEREANIAMAARLEAQAEAQRLARESEPAEYLTAAEKIYGRETPEQTAATELLKTALKGVEDRAMQRALEQFREEQRQQSEAVRKSEAVLDGFIDDVEDTYNVTMSKDMQEGYFKLMAKLSPKDSAGNIIQYADPHAVWEEYAPKIQKKQDTKAKDLASRSIVQTPAAGDSKLVEDVNLRFLKENDLI